MAENKEIQQLKDEYEKLKNIKPDENNGNKKLIKLCKKYKIKVNKKESINSLHIKIQNKINNVNQNYEENNVCKRTRSKCKSKNKENESILLDEICQNINTKSGVYYNQIINDFQKIYSKTIDKVEKKGSCNESFDLLFIFTDNTKIQCEVKESSILPLNKWKTPWDGACQLVNGIGKNFKLCIYYAEQWYEQCIKSNKLRIEFDIPLDVETPIYEEWLKNDAFAFKKDDKLTKFTSVLKKKYKKNKTNKEKMKNIKNDFVKNLKISDTLLDEFINNLNNHIENKLNVKECYLSIYKDTIKLWNKIETPKIKKEDIYRINESTDLVYKLNTNLKIEEIRIRFQNTIGIANISCKIN